MTDMKNNTIFNIDEFSKPICIFGAGQMARMAILIIEAIIGTSNQINACVVSSTNNNPKEIEGIPVISVDEYLCRYPECKILIAVRKDFLNDVMDMLRSKGCRRIDIFDMDLYIEKIEQLWIKNQPDLFKLYSSGNKNNLTKEEYLLFLSNQLKSDTINIEVNLANHCNLNCQCCNHYSPLAKEEFIDKEQYLKDISRLKELYNGRIGRVMLIGGEPLLYKDICSIFSHTRKILPKTSIYIITNGLLFPQMTSEFWNSCRENEIGIKVTEYPINFNYSYWMEYAKSIGVEMVDENPEVVKTTYRLPISRHDKYDPIMNYMKCYHANQCVVLRDGRLYPCPISAWIDILNDYFKESLPSTSINSIDIYEVDNSEEVDCFLKRPIELCKHCDIFGYQYNIPWKQSQRLIQETSYEKSNIN